MAKLVGLFSRNASYYLKVVLPTDHPARDTYKSGRVVVSLGCCTQRDAVRLGTIRRAEILAGTVPGPAAPRILADEDRKSAAEVPATTEPPTKLRDVYDRWAATKERSADSLRACKLALRLFEEFTGNPPLSALTRAQGNDFRAWLIQPARGTTSKTARDRFTWVKSLLKYAHRDLEALNRQPWEGLEIDARTTHRRRPWHATELQTLASAPVHSAYHLPTLWNAGKDAAYWLPIISLYSGARLSELAQMRVGDVDRSGPVPVMRITDEGAGQRVKTQASVRLVPVHSELIRLGFLKYVGARTQAGDVSLWPALPIREEKPGSFFSAWFCRYRRGLGFARFPDFHSFRHNARSALASDEVPEHMIDTLIGHEVRGSTGAKVYTHRSLEALARAVERITYPVQFESVYGL